MNKSIRIFLSEKQDKKRIFETIRMALGITLKGHIVELYVSSDVPLDSLEKEKREEIEEFLQAIKYMGGNYIFVEDIQKIMFEKIREKGKFDILVV